MKQYDVAVVGGGVMGAFTARALANKGARVVVIEQYQMFNPYSASGGKTRSFRVDYLDPFYCDLAREAKQAWLTFEAETGIEMLDSCGCLNLWDQRLKVDWQESYAGRAARTLNELGVEYQVLEREQLPPIFDCERAMLDTSAGILKLGSIHNALRIALENIGVGVFENQRVQEIAVQPDNVRIATSDRNFLAKKIVLASGRWIEDSLTQISGIPVPNITLTLDRPLASVYCIPSAADMRVAQDMPVFACLDVGIYGHPMIQGATRGVKIGVFRPFDASSALKSWSIERFLERFMPNLLTYTREAVADTDLCCYDNTADGNFVVGSISEQVVVASGFCGTGYKFAPVIGTMVSECIEGSREYLPSRFDPWRFGSL